jgi:hypothetical protein
VICPLTNQHKAMSYPILPEFQDDQPSMRQQIEDFNRNNPPAMLNEITEEKLLAFLEELLETRPSQKRPIIYTAWRDAAQVISVETHKTQGTEPPDSVATFLYDMTIEPQREIIRKHIALGKEFHLAYQGTEVVSSIHLKP